MLGLRERWKSRAERVVDVVSEPWGRVSNGGLFVAWGRYLRIRRNCPQPLM